MREVDPIPAQIASMDKDSVLRLLGLLTGGTLLKRGAEVQVGVSRWAWGLLARLPDRGELTSEEIGIVRELGKKAVLVGMGLKEEQAWEEGMNEVEAGFDEDDYEGDGSVINDDEIYLGIEVGLEDGELEPVESADNPIEENESNKRLKIGPQFPSDYEAPAPLIASEPADERVQSSLGSTNHNEMEGEVASEDLAAAKARILAALGKSKAEEDQQETQQIEEEKALQMKKSAARWNTKATVDMIITVAGEMYGQRDLLEFRQTWGEIEGV